MSAFLCGDDHFMALAFAAVTDRYNYGSLTLYHRGKRIELNAQQIVDLLYRENRKSLFARYSDRDPAFVGKAKPPTYRQPPGAPLPAVSIIKMIHCYEYQACEHKSWHGSLARAVAKAIEAHALRRLPGYDDAPWEYSRSAA